MNPEKERRLEERAKIHCPNDGQALFRKGDIIYCTKSGCDYQRPARRAEDQTIVDVRDVQ